MHLFNLLFVQTALLPVLVLTVRIVGDTNDLNDKRKKVNIGAVFPMSAGMGGWPGGEGCLPAATMALEDVNRMLREFRIVMYWEDSECQPGLGAKRMYELLYSKPIKVLLLAGCSLVTTVIAEAAPVWNLVVLAYGASSPALSNRERFPTLFRTHPSATIHNPTRIKLFQKFNWHKIAILQSVEEVFTTSFFGDPAPAVRSIKRQDVRIIVGLFYEKEARKVFCEVYKENLYGKRYVWIILGWYGDSWFVPTAEDELNCTAEQMYNATQYHFTTEMLMHSQEETLGVSGMNSYQFAKKLSSRLNKDPSITGGFPEAPLAYDAIWSAVFALNCSIEKWKARNLSLDDFSYEDATMAQEIYNCMKHTKFRGVSGEVMFSEKGERIAWTLVEQLQDGKYEVMGYYDYRSDNLSWRNREKFIDGYIPPDEMVIQEKWIAVSHLQFVIFAAIGALGIIWACFNGSFNIIYRYRRIIYESCAEVNDIMLVGCVVCIVGIVLIGLPTERGLVAVDKYFCHARALMLMYGFSLLFGSLFSKALMAHRLRFVTTKPKELKSWMFYATIGLFLCMDTLIIAAWIAVDPMHRSVQYFDVVDGPEENIKFRPAVEQCTSENQKTWIGLIYSYKGFLLLFGLFLAYEARNMKTKQMNDSRFVSMAIYNVAILCCITGPVAVIVTSQPDANFTFCATTIILCTFTSMGLLFVPKMMHVFFEPNFSEEKYFGDQNLSSNQERLNALLEKNNDLKAIIAEKRKQLAEIESQKESDSRGAMTLESASAEKPTTSSTKCKSPVLSTFSTKIKKRFYGK